MSLSSLRPFSLVVAYYSHSTAVLFSQEPSLPLDIKTDAAASFVLRPVLLLDPETDAAASVFIVDCCLGASFVILPPVISDESV
jgi:hypothetical protein